MRLGQITHSLLRLVFFLGAVSLPGGAFGNSTLLPSAPNASGVAVQSSSRNPKCNGIRSLWSHVYRPERFEVRKPCIAVVGVIAGRRTEPDGDYHIQLDIGDSNLLNDVNRARQHGNLVVEPVCMHGVTQASAQGFCDGFQSTVPLFPKGTRVRVTGSYVLDNEHGWMEIHPVLTMQEINQ
jgi:hypothetical protein